MQVDRRAFVLGGLAVTVPTFAQHHNGHGLYARLNEPGLHPIPANATQQRSDRSPAPAGPHGRWEDRASLPLPRSEMAWATAWAGRMHIIGGYADQRVDRPYHHIYDPGADRWSQAAPLPRGGNHVAVVADAGRIYALGAMLGQNRNPDALAFAYDVKTDRWDSVAPLPRARGAGSAVALGGMIHLIGGASGPTDERPSVGWHEVYDPTADRWAVRKPLPGARDHAGAVVWQGAIHVIGGRFNTFEFNTALHHRYDPKTDQWEVRAPMPTVRSGHGLVVHRNRFFAMGGEEGRFVSPGRLDGKVFAQVESYDPTSDNWLHHAPMKTARHGLGAVVLGDWIHVAGGGPVVGGGTQSAVHEAFTLD